ncbi:hypothetical protein ABIB85_007260 [Bradyrhizobium sp. JR1.5]|nr:hypothetical protein Bra1253DRAFT_03093 [Bradyrhizobium sp. WSM1253]
MQERLAYLLSRLLTSRGSECAPHARERGPQNLRALVSGKRYFWSSLLVPVPGLPIGNPLAA